MLLDRDPALRSRLVVPIVGGPSGSGLEHPESLAQLAAELGLDDVVRFVPPVAQAELARWCAAATAVAVPSYNESFGLVAAEAQATGTPVVAAAVGGLTTVVADGAQRPAGRRPRRPRLGRPRCAGSSTTPRSRPGSAPARSSTPATSPGSGPPSARSTAYREARTLMRDEMTV